MKWSKQGAHYTKADIRREIEFISKEYDNPAKCPGSHAHHRRITNITGRAYRWQGGFINFAFFALSSTPYCCHGLDPIASMVTGQTYPICFPSNDHWAYQRFAIEFHASAYVRHKWANGSETVPHLRYYKDSTDFDIMPMLVDSMFTGWERPPVYAIADLAKNNMSVLTCRNLIWLPNPIQSDLTREQMQNEIKKLLTASRLSSAYAEPKASAPKAYKLPVSTARPMPGIADPVQPGSYPFGAWYVMYTQQTCESLKTMENLNAYEPIAQYAKVVLTEKNVFNDGASMPLAMFVKIFRQGWVAHVKQFGKEIDLSVIMMQWEAVTGDLLIRVIEAGSREVELEVYRNIHGEACFIRCVNGRRGNCIVLKKLRTWDIKNDSRFTHLYYKTNESSLQSLKANGIVPGAGCDTAVRCPCTSSFSATDPFAPSAIQDEQMKKYTKWVNYHSADSFYAKRDYENNTQNTAGFPGYPVPYNGQTGNVWVKINKTAFVAAVPGADLYQGIDRAIQTTCISPWECVELVQDMAGRVLDQAPKDRVHDVIHELPVTEGEHAESTISNHEIGVGYVEMVATTEDTVSGAPAPPASPDYDPFNNENLPSADTMTAAMQENAWYAAANRAAASNDIEQSGASAPPSSSPTVQAVAPTEIDSDFKVEQGTPTEDSARRAA